MGYMHIDNLYKNRDILMFRQCFALEKVHGTSAHIKWDAEQGKVTFFSGGASHLLFIKLFDEEALKAKFMEIGCKSCTVYGEAYGGKMQGMKDTYGSELRFIVFDVEMSDKWLDVPKAEGIARFLGLEFVPYELVSTDIEVLDAERDKPSVVAHRRGMGEDKKREGVVLRPIMEVTKNNGGRVISKHKSESFCERKNTPSASTDPETLRAMSEATAIADEWVTEMRLTHVIDKFPAPYDMSMTPDIMRAMVEDIEREAKGEIIASKEARKAISRKTAAMFQARMKASLREAS